MTEPIIEQSCRLCLCGCGQPTKNNLQTGMPNQWIKGHSLKVHHGNGRASIPVEQRFWCKVSRAPGQGPSGDCWEWQGVKHDDGYGFIIRNRKQAPAHRIAYELVKGPIPSGLVVRHTCDNPPCCNPAHLIPGTIKQNARDAQERNRLRKYSGITPDDVREIRRMYASKEKTRRQLLAMYPISASSLRDILIRHTWKHVV